ncbi:MAG: flavodoxin domain-containing protein [Candidatus Zixiibacteriota bacterium]
MKAIIVYQSAYGHVYQMAEKTKTGLEEEGVEVTLSKAGETNPDDLLDKDIVVFGSPVRMGSIGGEMKTFIDKTGQLWMNSALTNKVAGVLTSGAGFNVGLEMTQIALYSTLMELGMVLVGYLNNMPGYGKGANQWSPFAQVGLEGKDGPNPECLEACYNYGKRLAWVGKKFAS